MANNNLNIISSSKYDIYSKLLDIAASHDYIATNSELSNIDFLRTGLFGYVTESLAMILRDSAFHNTMVYRENFLNTAIMPTSIYNWAKMFNVNCINATPSLRYATIVIDTNSIDQVIQNTTASVSSYRTKYGIVEAGNFMVLDKTNPIVAGNYYFSLEHSVEIYKNQNGKYIVKYCLNEQNKTTEFGTYSDGGIINTAYEITNSAKYLTFKVLVAQYKTVETSKIITGSTYLDTRVHKFEYNGQICGMSLSYSKGNTTEEVELKFSNINLQADKESENKVAYYSVVDDNNIEISFLSNSTSGLPQTGGQLLLKMFITEGYNGNISYNGDSVFLIKQDDFKSIPINVILDSDIYSSGVDQTSISDIKETIINQLSTRDVIITENDLNIWFGTQSKLLEDVGNSKITFRKEKDNILRRTFSAYLLLRDGATLDQYLNTSSEAGETTSVVSSSYISNVVPTNTVDVIVNTSRTRNSDGDISINTTDTIGYDINTQTYLLGTNGSTDFIYRTPFNITLNTTYNQVSYMYLETNDSSELEFTNVEQMDNMTIIPTQVTVTHENPTSDENTDNYIFTFNISSDTDLTSKTIKSLEMYFDDTKYTISTIPNFVATDNDDDSTTSGLSNYKFVITAQFVSTETTSEATMLKLKLDDNNIVQLTESSKVSVKLEFTGFEGTMSSVDTLTYFTQLDDIISSNLVINYNADNSVASYTIKDVPVVANYWITSKVNKSWFIRQLFVYINMLKANINKLETTTFFNIKFRNTYGFSHYYNSINTQLRLGLTIYINRDKATAAAQQMQLTTSDDVFNSLKNEIRDYIRVLVDKSNESGELVISKIIMQTQAQYYNFITHIDFNGLNNTFNQYIKQINTSDISYPLEYFSLDETLDSTGKSRLASDINFVFE